MARSDDLDKAEASKKRLGLMEDGVKSESAEKKSRPLKTIHKVSRKRAWDEVAQTDTNLNYSQDLSTHRRNSTSNSPSRKVIRIDSTKKSAVDGDKLVEHRGTRKFRDSEPNMEGSGSLVSEMGGVQNFQLSKRKWKRTPRNASSGRLEQGNGTSGTSLRGGADISGGRTEDSERELGTRSAVEVEKMGKPKQIREDEVVRKVLQTVHLEESRMAGEETITEHEEERIGMENDSAGIVSSLEQTALDGRDRKRRGTGKGDASPPRQPEKKLRIDVSEAEASSRGGEQGVRTNLANTSTWKRLKEQNIRNRTAASDDMGISVSEAWKRLREEKGSETSGSSVNGRLDSDLSMHSSDSELGIFEERLKKARYNLPLPPQGRTWTRKSREKKDSSSSKRLRESNGCESSGSSGSDIAQSSYLHNRKWKRPRFEDLMSAQDRLWRRQARDIEEAREDSKESTRKRALGDPSEKSSKRQRK